MMYNLHDIILLPLQYVMTCSYDQPKSQHSPTDFRASWSVFSCDVSTAEISKYITNHQGLHVDQPAKFASYVSAGLALI